MNSKNKMLSGIGWTYAERLLAQVVSFLVSIVLASLLASADSLFLCVLFHFCMLDSQIIA